MADEDDFDEEEEEGGEGGGLKGLLKKVFLFLILLIVGAIAAAFFLMPQEEEEEKKEILREGPAPLENPLYVDLGPMVINLKGGKYFLKANLHLGFAEPAPKIWLEARLPIVKDMVLTQLQTLNAKQVVDARARTRLKQKLMIRLNSLFPNKPMWQDPKPVKRILFQEFYRQ